MTLAEIRESSEAFLRPEDIAPLYHCKPQSIREANPGDLGFRVSRIGTRVKIPRQAFLDFMEKTDGVDTQLAILTALHRIEERLTVLETRK